MTDAQRFEVIALRGLGFSWEEVARRMGVSRYAARVAVEASPAKEARVARERVRKARLREKQRQTKIRRKTGLAIRKLIAGQTWEEVGRELGLAAKTTVAKRPHYRMDADATLARQVRDWQKSLCK